MPAHNAEAMIAAAIDSVRRQTYCEWELLVVDDRCEDRTVAIAKDCCTEDPRISLHHTDLPGVSGARNCGIKLARGDYITFLDADDLYLKNAIRSRLRLLQRHRDIAAVFCAAEIADAASRRLGMQVGLTHTVDFRHMWRCPFHVDSVMVRTSLLRKFSFPLGIENGEDWLLWARMARSGVTFHRVRGVHVLYRAHHNSTVALDRLKHEVALEKVLALIYGPDPQCTAPDPRFAEGLCSPAFKQVLLKKRLGRLVTCLLLDKEDEAHQLAATFDPWVCAHISRPEVFSIIRSTFQRFYICSAEEWLQHWAGRRRYFRRFWEEAFPAKRYPNMDRRLFRMLDCYDRNLATRAYYEGRRVANRCFKLAQQKFPGSLLPRTE
jgi:glycosyltransferase involved in cell wall biosynthesis